MEALTRAMYGDETRVGDLYRGYTNPFGKQASSSYRWTQLNAEILTQVLALLGGQRIRFIVEVGSFAGGLAMVLGRFAAALPTSPPVLCIDTWLGDLNMALGKLERRVIDKRHGDPTMYHQFLVNIIAANLTRHVVRRWESNLRLYYCPLLRHVRIPCSQLPMRAPSFLGAAMLAHLGLAADLLYLDSAHELRETFFELTLYWAALAPGGVLMGDDLNWRAVNRDVKLFARVYGQKLRSFDGCHALRSSRHADGSRRQRLPHVCVVHAKGARRWRRRSARSTFAADDQESTAHAEAHAEAHDATAHVELFSDAPCHRREPPAQHSASSPRPHRERVSASPSTACAASAWLKALG
jgi:hypothetical protein